MVMEGTEWAPSTEPIPKVMEMGYIQLSRPYEGHGTLVNLEKTPCQMAVR